MSNPAQTYESYMVPTLFGPWASQLIERARPHPGERVLDVACGTGVVARRARSLVGPSGKVVGLDLNPHMLTVAREKAEGEAMNVEWHEGRAEELPFPASSFDLVLCQAGLMFFVDRNAALGEMGRVLTNDGRVFLSVLQGLDRHPFYRKLDEAIRNRLGMSAVEDIFALGDSDRLRESLKEAGFCDVRIEPVSIDARFPHPESFLAGEIDVDTAAIPSMQHLDEEARRRITAAIREDMEASLQEVTEDDHVALTFHTLVVAARRRERGS